MSNSSGRQPWLQQVTILFNHSQSYILLKVFSSRDHVSQKVINYCFYYIINVTGASRSCFECCYTRRDVFYSFIFSFSLSNRGPPQEEALVPTNSNVQRPHPPPTRTQGPNRLSLRYPLQLSPWSSPCPPRQPCHSTQQQHSSLPPSLNATHSLCLCAWVRPLNATMLPQQLPSLPALEVKFLTLNQLHKKKTQLQRFVRGKETRWQLTLSEAGRLPNPLVALLNLS